MPKTLEKRPTKTQKTTGAKPRSIAPAPVEHTEPVESLGPVCAHHWVIASPNGEMSMGRCKVCGTEKEFPNSADDYLWERSVPQSRWTGRSEGGSTAGFNSGY